MFSQNTTYANKIHQDGETEIYKMFYKAQVTDWCIDSPSFTHTFLPPVYKLFMYISDLAETVH